MDQSNDPAQGAAPAAGPAADGPLHVEVGAATVDNTQTATAQPAAITAVDSAAPAGPDTASAGAAQPADGTAQPGPVTAATDVQHPVLSLIERLRNEIVARSHEELAKLHSYVNDIEKHISDLL